MWSVTALVVWGAHFGKWNILSIKHKMRFDFYMQVSINIEVVIFSPSDCGRLNSYDGCRFSTD